ncbi:Tim44/TimA family putative adaptor protein [Chelatococcus asaccharovorans]|uniref:Tim44/TimA family putative adaptor protein n=1 Tax=Chelatococcus asaccharovorans TaxID=28210 RepID=UPI00224C6472|nr:Tim44/TimA family putative adaptor protein [Chelatococcus asaccharovorans]CAH1661885.1 Tim44 domain-containing protein [Chelatococcus asaccharovorans]CAH1689407.1 Tim44 domain-containing protein [Chelatococcus asaccharovorans]
MNEATDPAYNIPAIILLSFWWVFLSGLDFLSTPRESGEQDLKGRKSEDDKTAATDDDPRLAAIRELDPTFDTGSFLEGARRAYEAVLHAYALGDLKTLRRLLSTDVLQVFSDACAARRESQETLELTLIGIDGVEIVQAETAANWMEISVRFRAQIVSAERSADGTVIGGDPAAVTTTNDLWTFSRPVPVDNPWIVVATDEG